MKKGLLTIVTFCFLVTSVYAFESFTIETEAKAYKKVTIEYYAQDYEQVHDSTVTIWYDKDGVEIHRKVVKGCSNRKDDDVIWSNPIGVIDTSNYIIWDLYQMDIDTTICDSLLYQFTPAIPKVYYDHDLESF